MVIDIFKVIWEGLHLILDSSRPHGSYRITSRRHPGLYQDRLTPCPVRARETEEAAFLASLKEVVNKMC